jgi:uncharacterized protein (TIGR01244 family)
VKRSPARVFWLALVVGAVSTLAWLTYQRVLAPSTHWLAGDVGVSSQLAPHDVDRLRGLGYRSLIDLRPDGEAADQPSADAMRRAAGQAHLVFRYVPVPHGDIPERVVDELAQALKDVPRPVLLYCRTGRRAARTWALVEARRPGGLPPAEIEQAVKNAGQDADDLDGALTAGAATRSAAEH